MRPIGTSVGVVPYCLVISSLAIGCGLDALLAGDGVAAAAEKSCYPMSVLLQVILPSHASAAISDDLLGI